MTSTEQPLNHAIQLYSSGRYIDAIDACEGLLAQQPSNADALYVMGVCRHCLGRTDDARAAVERAIEINPGNKHYYLTLGQLLALTGDLDGARQLYDRALEIDPDFPEVLNNVAALYLGQRRFFEAEACLRRALEGSPRFPEARCNLGVVAAETGRVEEAIDCYRQAIADRPDYPDAESNLANALNSIGEYDQAVAVLRPLLDRHPRFAAAHNALGSALFCRGDHPGARACFERALAIEPDFCEALGNVANVLSADGDPAQAREAYESALKLDPRVPKVHFNYAMALLGEGDYQAGWREFEWRMRSADWLRAHPWFREAGSLWDGGEVPGRCLVVRGEQGFGDVIQFARFLPRVRERVGTLVLEAPRPLRRLLESAPGVDRFVVGEADRIATRGYDYFLPIMSLPHRLGVDSESIPGASGYLSAPTTLAEPLAEALAVGGLKVGFVWAGSAGHQDDRYRSCSAELFRPLLDVDGVSPFSLQVGPRAGELARLDPRGRVVELNEMLGDFADTAAVIQHLDLVISVDTAVVHLAGALGCECWVLLAKNPDWRWLESGEVSPWYERATLFRQAEKGEWGGVIDSVLRRLRERSASHGYLAGNQRGS